MSDKDLKAQIKAAQQLEQLREDEKTFGKVPATEFPADENTQHDSDEVLAKAPGHPKLKDAASLAGNPVDSRKGKMTATAEVNEEANQDLQHRLTNAPKPGAKKELKQEYRSVPTPTPIPGR